MCVRSRLLIAMIVVFRSVLKDPPAPVRERAEAGGGQNLARSPTEIRRPSGFDTKPLNPNAPPMMPAVLPL